MGYADAGMSARRTKPIINGVCIMELSGLGAPLDIEQIDFRVQSVTKNGYAIILAYKNARVDMDRLDKVVGRGKWQRKHELIDGQLFCSVGIYNEDINQWIWVQDVGTESNTEKEKGRASDSFKRACFNLGIGRELYEYPFIMVKQTDAEKVDKYAFKLKEWKWYKEHDEKTGELTFIAAKDNHGKVRFQFGKMKSGS